MAYNKIYQGFLWMGGGKLSYDIQLKYKGQDLLLARRFVRINTKEIGYAAYLFLQKEGNNLKIEGQVAKPLEDPEAKEREVILNNNKIPITDKDRESAILMVFGDNVDSRIGKHLLLIENQLANEKDARVVGLSGSNH